MFLTPFSGLTLIIHLLIIALSSFFNLFTPVKSPSELMRKEQLPPGVVRRWSKYILSVLLIISVSTFVFVSLAITIETSMREGAQERHIQYIMHELRELQQTTTFSYTSNN